MSPESDKQAGDGETAKQEVPVRSNTPENDTGKLNPSAPEDSNTTPGSTPKI